MPFILRLLKNSIDPYLDRRMLIMLLLGFSSGLPLLLTSSTLAIRLDREFNISYTEIGLLNIATIPYATKFLLSLFIDHINIPSLTKNLGKRRSWLILSQFILIISIFNLAFINPSQNLFHISFFVFFVSLSSAIQDIVVLAYQAERLNKRQYGAGEGITFLGYRLGMLISSAGALYMSTILTWSTVYLIMGLLIFTGIITVLFVQEPITTKSKNYLLLEEQTKKYFYNHKSINHTFAKILSWLYAVVYCSFKNFSQKQGWVISIMLVIFYKLGDNLIGTMSNLLYISLGFSDIEIANASKVFGLCATILGSIVGGILITKIGILRSLLVFGILHGLATLMYIILINSGYNVNMLYFSIALENITGGMRTSALFAYILTLSSLDYAAKQIAILVSCIHLGRTIFSSLSGWLVDSLGWTNFFYLAAIASIPGVILSLILIRINQDQHVSLKLASLKSK